MENEKNIFATIYLPIFEYIFAIKAINQLEFYVIIIIIIGLQIVIDNTFLLASFLFFEKCLFTNVIVRDHKKYERDKQST